MCFSRAGPLPNNNAFFGFLGRRGKNRTVGCRESNLAWSFECRSWRRQDYHRNLYEWFSASQQDCGVVRVWMGSASGLSQSEGRCHYETTQKVGRRGVWIYTEKGGFSHCYLLGNSNHGFLYIANYPR